MVIETGDAVTLEFTGRLDDGTVFDTTRQTVAEDTNLDEAQPDREYSPITLEVGADQVIPGLEDALLGLEEGTSETVTIPPADAYGEWEEDHVREYEAEEFQQMVGGETPEEGAYLETENGGIAEITHAGEQEVRVDFNHQLAGETLEFDLEVIDIS